MNTKQVYSLSNLKVILLSFFLLPSFSLNAQLDQVSIKKTKDAMNKLQFLLGQWEGQAFIMYGENKQEVFQTEFAQLKLDSTLIQIEGKGYKSSKKKEVIFQAMAIISYDIREDKYLLRAYKDGTFVDVELGIEENNRLVWEHKIPNGIKKNTIQFIDNKWIEKGEFSRDGKKYFKIFEMNLHKLP